MSVVHALVQDEAGEVGDLGWGGASQVVWWLRHGASNSTRSKVRSGDVGGSYIKPSLLYLSLKHCRPNTNYGSGGGGGC